jgi:plastocyanin
MLTAVLLLQACGALEDSPSIFVEDDYFQPPMDSLTAGRNDSVTVVFRWGGSHSHTLTWDSGPGTLPDDAPTMIGGTFQVVLVTGTYLYHCAIHDAAFGMRGTIVVSPYAGARAF